MSCPPGCLQNHSFPFVDILPATPHDESLVSFCLRLACLAACDITCFFYLPTCCPHRRLPYRLFVLLLADLPAAPLAASLVSFRRDPKVKQAGNTAVAANG
jgi:hypothetical protein